MRSRFRFTSIGQGDRHGSDLFIAAFLRRQLAARAASCPRPSPRCRHRPWAPGRRRRGGGIGLQPDASRSCGGARPPRGRQRRDRSRGGARDRAHGTRRTKYAGSAVAGARVLVAKSEPDDGVRSKWQLTAYRQPTVLSHLTDSARRSRNSPARAGQGTDPGEEASREGQKRRAH